MARWELARRLKLRRHEVGVSVDQIAKHLGFTRNFYSAVENERSLLAAEKLALLLIMLEFSDEEKEELTALSEAARNRGWWETKDFADLMTEEGIKYIGLEVGAKRIRTYDGLVLPGLLQLPEYTKAALETDPFFSELELNVLVRLRRQRQDAVRKHTPYTALFSEAALRQRWGSDILHNHQLTHLLECTKTFHHLELRILRFSSSPGALAASSTLSLLEFDSPHLPGVCYQEAVRDVGIVVGDDPQYDRLDIAYESTIARALTHEQSVEFINGML